MYREKERERVGGGGGGGNWGEGVQDRTVGCATQKLSIFGNQEILT